KPVSLAPGVSVRLPDGILEIDGERMGLTRPPPSLGQHQDEVLGALPAPAANTDRPFAGLRVLDLGVIVVGAEQSRLFADLGADVIKVENAAFPDGSRQSRGGEPMTASFAAGHRNKRSMGLNLRDPEGVKLF